MFTGLFRHGLRVYRRREVRAPHFRPCLMQAGERHGGYRGCLSTPRPAHSDGPAARTARSWERPNHQNTSSNQQLRPPPPRVPPRRDPRVRGPHRLGSSAVLWFCASAKGVNSGAGNSKKGKTLKSPPIAHFSEFSLRADIPIRARIYFEYSNLIR